MTTGRLENWASALSCTRCVVLRIVTTGLFFCYLQKLRTSWSKRFGELAKDVFIRSVPAQSSLSAQSCEELWVNLEQGLAEELQQAECAMKLQLDAMTAQLNEDEKVVKQLASHQSYFVLPLMFVIVL